jgi:putative transposase
MVIRRRLDLKGQSAVFVTTTIVNFVPVFSDRRIADALVQQVRNSVNHYHVSVIGWVLMPTHFHALLGFPQIEFLSQFMRDFKGLSSKMIEPLLQPEVRTRLFSQGKFRLWKARFDEVIIYSGSQFEIKLNYIHNNPVKAHLVGEPVDWDYSSAGAWMTDRVGLIPIDKEWKWI